MQLYCNLLDDPGGVSEKMKVLLCRDGPNINVLPEVLLYMYCVTLCVTSKKIIYPHEAD